MSFEQIASSKQFSVSDAIGEQIRKLVTVQRLVSAIGFSQPPLPFLKGEGLGVGFATSKFCHFFIIIAVSKPYP